MACFVIFAHIKYRKKSGPYETNGFSPDKTPETGNKQKHKLECWLQSSLLPNSGTPCMGLAPVPDREPDVQVTKAESHEPLNNNCAAHNNYSPKP
jgi:hypothetical protein